jgi:hypothetical protein
VDAPGGTAGWRLAPARLSRRLARHQTLLWWIHSAYVLALGMGIMWLGSRNFSWLRYSGFYLLAICVLSVLLADIVNVRDGKWWARARLAVNYVNKNLYQQLLFFILPIYAASTTIRSRNLLFVCVLAASAVTSTLDLVYDRVLSVRRPLAAWFFAFNTFAVVNVALPVLFGVSTHLSLRLSAVAAAAGFVAIAWRGRRLRRWPALAAVSAGAVVVFWAADVTRPFVPPAPLRLVSTEFGSGLDRATLLVTGRMTSLPADFTGRVYIATALRAPLGLKDRVELRWYRGGKLLWSSAPHTVSGGRPGGFRLWSSIPVAPAEGSAPVTIEVVTEAGQLVGRAVLFPAS